VNRIPAALALFALLSPMTATAEPCAPRVELSGDRDAVARVAVELKTLGVVLGPIEPASGSAQESGPLGSVTRGRSCSVSAMVVVEGEGISVAVQNASRRSEGRVVGDPKIAAAWIDSWLRDEIEVASWTIAMPATEPPSALTSTPVALTDGASFAPLPIAPAVTVSPLERFGLSAAFERSWTNDETTWDGFDITGCMRVGAVCLGGRLRAGFQYEQRFNDAIADRSDIVALGTVSIPFTVGQVSIAPELGLGVGRMRTQRVEACSAPPPSMGMEPNTPGCSDPTDPMCQMVPIDPGTGASCIDASGTPTNEKYVGDSYDKTTYLPRVALALRFAFPIVRHVWLDAVAAYTLTPITSRVGFDDPDTMVQDENIAMPAEPWKGYQLGVGIRVGIP
jgi:hypothetical protein